MSHSDIDPGVGSATSRALRDAVVARSGAFPPVLALHELVLRGDEETADLLHDLAKDRDEDVAIRFEAASGLATLTAELANPTLRDLLADSDPTVVTAALRALSVTGDNDDLTAILRVEDRRSSPPTVRREANAAGTLISHRLRSSRHVFRLPGATQLIEPASGEATEIVSSRPTRRQVSDAIDAPTLGPTAIAPSVSRDGFEFECVGRQTMVVPSSVLDADDGLASLADRPAIAGLVLSGANLSLERYHLSGYVLTKPGRRRSVDLAFQNLRGRVWLIGVGTPVEASRLEFTLRGVRTRNAAPTLIEGSFSQDRQLQLQRAESGERFDRTRRPAKAPARARG